MSPNRDDTAIMIGGRKFRPKRLPMHVSMLVENESGGVYKLRERQTRGLQPADDDHFDEYSTPESGRNPLSDSGFSSTLEIDSDPDWFLRPKRPIDPRTIISSHSHDNSTVVTPPKMQRMFRPTYVDYSVSKFPKLNMERIIGGLIFIILVTSVCFGLLISSRFFESSQMELNGKYKSLQFGNRNSLSSDHIEPRIDSSSTLKDVKDSPPSHVPRLDKNVPKTPSKKLRRSKNLNPLMAKPKASMSKVRKLISKSFENDYEDPKFRGGVPSMNIENDYDVDPSFRGGFSSPATVNINHDYDTDPSFRGGFSSPAIDNNNHDYDTDPSFRGGKPSPATDTINNDYDIDTDPSFRGKNIYSDKFEGVVDLMGSV